MPDTSTIEKEWERLEQAVIPPTASTKQRLEMRRAFYAGAAITFHLLGTTRDMDTAAATAQIEKWWYEIESFARLHVQAPEGQA